MKIVLFLSTVMDVSSLYLRQDQKHTGGESRFQDAHYHSESNEGFVGRGKGQELDCSMSLNSAMDR